MLRGMGIVLVSPPRGVLMGSSFLSHPNATLFLQTGPQAQTLKKPVMH